MFQAMQLKSSGYTLRDLGQDKWQLQSSKGVFTGSMKQVINYAVIEFDFSISELELGIIEMNEHFHNAAEYGVLKSFMWTYDTEEKNESFNTKH